MEVMDYSGEAPEIEGADEDHSEESDNNDNDGNAVEIATPIEIPVEDTKNDDDDESKAKKAKETTTDESEVDSDQSCPICMDLWTSSGEHRLCCLRCGHLFGHSCLLRWLHSCASANRRCPQCNRKATVKDIRMLYAKKLTSIDTSELDKLKEQVNKVTTEKNRIEMELSKYALRQKLFEQQVASMQNRITELESQQLEISIHSNQNISKHMVKKFHLDRSIEICKDGGCRVLDYNPWYGFLVVSQKSTNALFSGYGIKKIDSEKFQPRQFIFLHSQAIRDIMFNATQQSLLLSVGFDKCAKLMDIQNHIIVHTYQTDYPLWSCCWSGDNPNIFFTGAQNGSITQFDIRQTSGAIETLDSPGDRSPVVSLATVPSNPNSGISRGGFIACRLNTCYAYEQKESKYVPKQIFLEGPFVSVCYDEKNNHALISSRPNARQPHARHIVCTIEKGNDETAICNVVHAFHAGNSQQLLSRPCYINVENDTLVAAHQESTSSISLWSISTGKQINSLPVSDPVVDMCAVDVNSNLFLATLSAKKVRIYSHG
ncbi:E3 ubiquitin-protein ligase RFWD3 isoform X1 [Hylaeus anthracinus]|uniref:E3 ubiquitin-protein ligase RFWD3-like isoform X1 n=1 Tax=Hylaeus anthracinus TaxID=313031 RepID=UPI0023BA2D47|nr:E3 ubiquitin-protein ligase RFWD3-like isoform X1 [Hylaeus anthracinus]XP_054010211.1 E3 ubiquitin-protein ligase RFWD3 isoform X1 [Hylaeus anthracinus]